jgi:hypothetical protein
MCFEPVAMSFDAVTIIDLLDGLDLDIQGFEDASPGGSFLFPLDGKQRHSFCAPPTQLSPVNDPAEAPTPLDVASDDEPFELLADIELGPRTWVAAGPPPIWKRIPQPIAVPSFNATKDTPRCLVFESLAIEVPPRSPSRLMPSRPLPKENLASPTERTFARLRDRGSSRMSLFLTPRVALTNVPQ